MVARGWHILATCRDTSAAQAMENKGVTPVHYDAAFGLSDAKDVLRGCHILISIPPDMASASPGNCPDVVLQNHQEDLREIAQTIPWVGYLSTTSIYGDWNGQEVDEWSLAKPTNSKGMKRVEAEQAWLEMHRQAGLPVHIFRLGGIYGPHRSALDAVRSSAQGTESESQRRRGQKQFTSRVHVLDICQTLYRSMDSPCPGEIYNVVDDDPSPRSVVMQYAAEMVRMPVPDAAQLLTTSGNPEKRVSNSKIKRDLGVVLTYPSYKEGLKAIHENAPDELPC